MTGYTNSCTAVTADSCITVPAHTGYITLLLFAGRQDRKCTCDVTLMGVRANMGGGFAVLGKSLRIGVIV